MVSARVRLTFSVLALASLVVLAGCVGPFAIPSDSGLPAPSESSETPQEPTSAGQSTDAAATAPPPTHPETQSPWGTEPVVVAIADSAETGRDWEPLVRGATAYWEENADQYAGYSIDYDVRPEAANPDIVVEFVEHVPECADAAEAAGCAPLIEDSRQIRRPETVFVRTDFSDDSTVLVLQHELGHTLGLTHDDAPADVMASASVLYTTARQNATERAFPWDDGSFTVYLDTGGASDPDAVRTQVSHALQYYEDGPSGVPGNLSFTFVDDPDAAEVTIRLSDSSPCAPGAASCGATSGWDPDGDGAVETYTDLEIVLVEPDTDAVGWHVGYWLAHSFGAEDDAEKPAPFRDATYSERRSEWWT
jgi:hypothetical protein